jgi:hypothetical protein
MTIFTYTVLHPYITNLAACELSGCATSMFIPLQGFRLNLEWLGWRRVRGLGGGGGVSICPT